MRRLFIIIIVFILAVVAGIPTQHPQKAEAGFRALAGQWNLTFEYCEYGVRLTVTAGIYDANVDGSGNLVGVPNPFTVMFQTQLRPSSPVGAIIASGQVNASIPAPVALPVPGSGYFFDTTGYFPWATGSVAAGTLVVSQFTVPGIGFEAWPNDATSALNNSTPPDYDDDTVLAAGSCSFTMTDVYGAGGSGFPGDNRLNTHAGATAVVYCSAGDTLIYGIDRSSQGHLDIILTASQASELQANGFAGLLNEVITEMGIVRFYSLGSGWYRVTGPDSALDPNKEYSFSWGGCS